MIKIFTGDDRVRAGQEIKNLLGADYEVIDALELTAGDLPNIFQGASLFAEHRRILLRDFTANRAVYSELPKYLSTPHDVIMLEAKLDKRSPTYKAIKDTIEIREFKLPEPNFGIVFDIYRTAKHDGRRAVEMLENIKPSEDPIKFTGLIISQAIKDFTKNPQGKKERHALAELSRLDIQQKTTGLDPWLLIESFLLRRQLF